MKVYIDGENCRKGLVRVLAKGAKVTYVCFADSTNRAVAAVASETVTISSAKAKKFVV